MIQRMLVVWSLVPLPFVALYFVLLNNIPLYGYNPSNPVTPHPSYRDQFNRLLLISMLKKKTLSSFRSFFLVKNFNYLVFGSSGRSNQSILKEINPGISLERMMLKLKLQYFGHLMWRVDLYYLVCKILNSALSPVWGSLSFPPLWFPSHIPCSTLSSRLQQLWAPYSYPYIQGCLYICTAIVPLPITVSILSWSSFTSQLRQCFFHRT